MSPSESDGRPPEERDPQPPPGGADESTEIKPSTWAGRQRTDGGGETIEADTLSLADREEAKEKAHAGVRARAAEHAAKREGEAGAPAPVEEEVGEEGADGERPEGEEGDRAEVGGEPEGAKAEEGAEQEEAEAEGDGAAAAATVLADGEKPPRQTLWARFVAASFLIVVSMATATAVSLLVYLTDIAHDLGGLENLTPNLTAVEAGKPQNFLLLGSDKRPGEGDRGRSDTTMLLRIDPGNQISLLSIPRDLKVNIPGLGPAKFNEAYTVGGPKLTLEVVQQLTQQRIPINHVVNVDFTGFANAVNAIGCVYIDVDHHYYHSNAGIAPGSEDFYSEIDIQAGYQRLCGLKALQYVRYRHGDNDLIRAARQQDFVREARKAVPPSELLDNYKKLTDIFTKYTSSDINSPATLINLVKLLFQARDAPVVQLHFPATFDDPYVTASDTQVQEVVTRFLHPEGPPAEEQSSGSSSGGGGSGGKPSGGESGGGGGSQPPAPPPVDLIDSTSLGQQYAGQLAATTGEKSGERLLDFPIYYPTRVAPSSEFSDESRAFLIDGPGDDAYRGYKIVISVPGVTYPTAYYGVSGTDWRDPPILDNPSEERDIDGRHFLLFYDGDRLRLVGWKTDKASYWVDNTLTQQLGEGQMLGIAASLREFTG